MAAILITGMSRVGKSTALAELRRRGYRTVDTDVGGWTRELRNGAGHVADHQWDEPRMAALLDEDVTRDLFVVGCVSNQGHFYVRFDVVVLLSLSHQVMVERLAARTNNPYGKEPDELERILRDHAEVEPVLRASADVELDGTTPVRVLADALEWLTAPTEPA
jgi:dephospho-CoA kinase